MKLIRKILLDSGSLLADGNQVSSECVTNIIARAQHDLKVTHRLSYEHIHYLGQTELM